MLQQWIRHFGTSTVTLAVVVGAGVWLAQAITHLKSTPGRSSSPNGPTATPYEPLQPGTKLTYETRSGTTFTREVMLPVLVPWWDGKSRRVVPVYDERVDGYFLYEITSDEVRVVGSCRQGRLERWGEHLTVLPLTPRRPNLVQTKAGDFPRAIMVNAGSSIAWYAEGVGLVKTDDYELVRHESGIPRSSRM